MFKATEVERKIREINLHMDLQRNLFSCRTSDCLLSNCHVDSLGTKNVLSMHVENFWKMNKSWQQKRYVRNHFMYIFMK